MTTHITKTWFVDGQIIEQVIPEAAIYKREWVGLTNEERLKIVRGFHATEYSLATAVEAKLKEKNV